MRKRLLFFTAMVLIYASCDDGPINFDQQSESTQGILITDIDHDSQAKELFQNALPVATSGRINTTLETSLIYKYFDIENDVINYSVCLPDESDEYFENLVISKIGEDFFGFILRYIPDQGFLSENGFQGQILRYNLQGDLIGDHNVPGGINAETGSSSGRTKFMYQCTIGYETYCWQEAEISTATGLPLPETVTTVCASEQIYGWCGDTAGPLSYPSYDSGWGTYIPYSSGGGTSGGGSQQYDPYSPNIQPTTTPTNYQSPIVIVDEPGAIDQKALFKVKSLTSK